MADMIRKSACIILAVLVTCLAPTAEAQLSPGPLQSLHSPWDGMRNCLLCHSLGKGVQTEKCLDCHELLAERIAAGAGLHSRADYGDCVSCHSDHQGENYAMIHWPAGLDAFDHGQAGYELEGAHARLNCRDCHRRELNPNAGRLEEAGMDPSRSYLGLDSGCVDCHVNPHRESLGGECRTCHDMMNWAPAPGFDHTVTDYPLRGRHADLRCAACHAKAARSEPEKQIVDPSFPALKHGDCVDCHADPHQGRFPGSCADCHDPSAWRSLREGGFDHDSTRYPLRGRHAGLACSPCHREGAARAPLSHDRCINCHEDVHRSQFDPIDCEACHGVDGFSPSSFTLTRHGEEPCDYPLIGAHLAVPCLDCHVATPSQPAGRFHLADRSCQACHTDPHGSWAPPPACDACHRMLNWRELRYDHAATGFPLESTHEQAACVACHPPGKGAVAPAFLGLSRACVDCHADIHASQFAVEGVVHCEACHDSRDWFAERFDHGRDSRFPLDGAHAPLACESCHAPLLAPAASLRFKPLAHECRDCHEDNPPTIIEVKP